VRSKKNTYEEIVDFELNLEELKQGANMLGNIWVFLKKSKTSINFFRFDPVSVTEIIKDVYISDLNQGIDVFYIAEFYGIKAEEVAYLPNGDEAIVEYIDSEESIRISYVKQTDKMRLKEIIAHELGHVFCHFVLGRKFKFEDVFEKNESAANNITYTYCGMAQASYNSSNNDEFEKEAQEFAIDLLFPEKIQNALMKKIEVIKDSTFENLNSLRKQQSK